MLILTLAYAWQIANHFPDWKFETLRPLIAKKVQQNNRNPPAIDKTSSGGLLRVELSSRQDRYSVDDPIRLTALFVNAGTTTIRLERHLVVGDQLLVNVFDAKERRVAYPGSELGVFAGEPQRADDYVLIDPGFAYGFADLSKLY